MVDWLGDDPSSDVDWLAAADGPELAALAPPRWPSPTYAGRARRCSRAESSCKLADQVAAPEETESTRSRVCSFEDEDYQGSPPRP